MDKNEKTDKRSLEEQVEDQLMDFILQEPVEIGGKIPNEFELAGKFGVGRSTIREAVKSLVSKGVLEVRRGSGTFVVSNSLLEDDPLGIAALNDKLKLALEICNVRLVLEPDIASAAAVHATEEQLKELQVLCDEVEKTYLNGEDHAKKDIEFHTCIARCTGNRIVDTLVSTLVEAAQTFADITQYSLVDRTIETHRAITEAIVEGDPTGARCAMIMHLTYIRQSIKRRIKETGKDR